MKRQLDRLKGKRLVTGDPNLMTKNEICINATPNGVEVKEIGVDGKIKDLAGSSGSSSNDEEEFFIFLQVLPQNVAVSPLNNIDKSLAPISSVLSTAHADSTENYNNCHLFKFHTSDILNPMTASESEIILGFSYKKIPIISTFQAGFRGFNYLERKGNLLDRIMIDGEINFGDEILPETEGFIQMLYSPQSKEYIKRVSKQEYDNFYITSKQLVEKDNI